MTRRDLPVWLLAIAPGTLLMPPLCAQPAPTQILQITDTAGCEALNPSATADGRRVAFTSTCDLTGGNPDGSGDIFLWTESAGFTQITAVPASFLQANRASINGAGDRVALLSDADLTGGNPDLSSEVYLWTEGSGLVQVTSALGGYTSPPATSADGLRVAFASDRDFVGGNADGNIEIFLWRDGTGVTQVTTTLGGSSDLPAIDADGSRIAFVSSHDFVGTNADGTLEIFLWTDGLIAMVQVTNSTAGISSNPEIDLDGTAIAFLSNQDFIGGNADGSAEVFRWTETGPLIQITDTAADAPESSISGDGRSIALRAISDLTGDNPDGNDEIFLWREGSPLLQITSSTLDDSVSPSISADGGRIAFISSADLVGANADGNRELFLARSASVLEIPGLDRAGLLCLIAALGFLATWRLHASRAVVTLLLIPALPAAVVAQITQVTVSSGDCGVGSEPSINADGTRVAFVSSCDMTGDNPDQSDEVHLWIQGTGVSQITDNPDPFLFANSVSIDALGNRVAFNSLGDLAGGNPDFSSEIFLWTEGSGLTQITNGLGDASTRPSLSADGARIAFVSSEDLTGGNGDGNSEIFLWIEGSGIVQVTSATGGPSSEPSINGDGTRIAFESNRDFAATNADASTELFLWTEGGGIAQVTSSAAGFSSVPSIDAGGTRISFVSNQNLAGGNADGSQEIFLWIEGSPLVQVTESSGDFPRASLSAGGGVIALQALSDLTGGNADGTFEIFRWREGPALAQITASASASDNPAIDASGARIAFVSVADHVGDNADGNRELFLARSVSVLEIPTLDDHGLLAMIGSLALFAAWALRPR